MCEKCLQSHNGYIGFRDHVVLTMEELSQPENRSKIKGKSYCKKHPMVKFQTWQISLNGYIQFTVFSKLSNNVEDHFLNTNEELDKMCYDEIKENKKSKGTQGGIVNLSQMWNRSPQRVTFDAKTGKLVATDAHCHLSEDNQIFVQMACAGFVCGPVDELPYMLRLLKWFNVLRILKFIHFLTVPQKVH
ncbi:Hypothetical predicted protein [Paramuricea clavata]|uniref:Uncharacterized protein n=1 Tax=Paramuricea clavata TaxID=317549 RepID=A0A7D9HTR0_PARCT|nr:Hypothetical predicted protein [Paramuricea clavata]